MESESARSERAHPANIIINVWRPELARNTRASRTPRLLFGRLEFACPHARKLGTLGSKCLRPSD
eukprot:499193-Prorocentrum_minimum.AAC.3